LHDVTANLGGKVLGGDDHAMFRHNGLPTMLGCGRTGGVGKKKGKKEGEYRVGAHSHFSGGGIVRMSGN